MYTFKADYSEPLADGGEKVIFKAGEKVTWETAKQLGLVTGEKPGFQIVTEPGGEPLKIESKPIKAGK